MGVLKPNGHTQEDIQEWIVAATTAINELIDDHASIVTELTAIGTTLADYKAIYDAHTHECPGSSFAASRCSTPDTGAAENSLTASAASAFTDTSGGAVPATLAASDPGTVNGDEVTV